MDIHHGVADSRQRRLSRAELARLLAATALTNVGLLAVYALGLVFSALGSDPVKAGVLAAAVLLVWSAAGLHAGTAFLSPFWHMKGAGLFAGEGSFPGAPAAPGGTAPPPLFLAPAAS